jgi:hypothetical protein
MTGRPLTGKTGRNRQKPAERSENHNFKGETAPLPENTEPAKSHQNRQKDPCSREADPFCRFSPVSAGCEAAGTSHVNKGSEDFLPVLPVMPVKGVNKSDEGLPFGPDQPSAPDTPRQSCETIAHDRSATGNPARDADGGPYGKAAGGWQRTWTGKVVSLADWRNLSEWERHGSTGKMWNGLTRQWEPDGGAA